MFLADFVKDLARPKTAVVPISLILERYLADRTERDIPGLVRVGWAHKPLTRYLGMKPPEALTEADCRVYAARRRAEGIKDGTIRTERQALRAALRWASKTGLTGTEPEVTMPRRPEARIRWLTREEAADLLEGCTAPHVRLFCLIALHTAARSGAILGLTWDRVDLRARLVDFRPPGHVQTRKRKVMVPVNDTLAATLAEAHAARTAEAVIEWAGGPWRRSSMRSKTLLPGQGWRA